jgi:hypothetical protein
MRETVHWVHTLEGLTEEAERMLKFEPNLNDSFVNSYR